MVSKPFFSKTSINTIILIASVDAAGHRSELEYNERDHLTKAFDALGNVS